MILNALDDPPEGLAELRAVLLGEHQWRQAQGLDPPDLVVAAPTLTERPLSYHGQP